MKRARNESDQQSQGEVKRIKLESNNETVKVLVVGDVLGHFRTIFSKVQQVNQQHGPFAALFCVGCFFGTESLSEEDEKFLIGDEKIPIPTYFIDAKSNPEITAKYLSDSEEGKELVENLHFLGNYGIKTINNLSVAYISGSENTSPHFQQEILHSWISNLPQPTCDLLLTCDWSHNVQMNLNKEDRVHPPQFIDFKTMGSKILSQTVLQQLYPKYHFCAQQGFYFERLPYKTQLENQEYVTRFIAMASVPKTLEEAQKDKLFKYIYAANITPIQFSSNQPLPQIPKFTENPFLKKATKRVATEELIEATRNRYAIQQVDPKEAASIAANCWFCLSNPKLEKHLLVHIGEDLYLAMPKGSVSSDSLMILPITHMQSLIQFTDAMWKELHHMLNNVLKPVFAKENKSLLLMERFIYSNRVPVHCYLNVVPIDNNSITSDVIAAKFETMGNEKHIQFTTVTEENENLCHEYIGSLIEGRCENTSYLWVKLPDGRKLVHRIVDFRTCSNFGREVCISLLQSKAELHWRDSNVTIEQETAICEQMKAKLKDYL